MVHLVGFILVGNVINQQPFAKASCKLAGGGYCNPENRIGEFEGGHEQSDLTNQQESVDRTVQTAGVERYDKGRDHQEALCSPSHRPGVTSKLAFYFGQQVGAAE